MHENTDMIEISADLLIPSLDELINKVFQSGAILDNPVVSANRLILSPLNSQADEVNKKILAMLPGTLHTFFSTNIPLKINSNDPCSAADHDIVVLNERKPTNFPPHILEVFIKYILF